VESGRPVIAAEIFAQPEGVEREEMIEEVERVAVRFSAHGTHTGQWMHFAPTGKSIQYTGITFARIAGHKIVAHHTWWDKASLIEQIARENFDRPG
jgi:predicted ester cyclase